LGFEWVPAQGMLLRVGEEAGRVPRHRPHFFLAFVTKCTISKYEIFRSRADEADENDLGDRRKGGSSLYALGRHLLVELHGCHPDLLKKVDVVKDILVGAARACGATIVDVTFHEFNPFGVSGVVVIAESHLSIHTWPEYRYAAVDIFTCGEVIKPELAVTYIASRFRCRAPSVVEMKRGMIPGAAGKLAHKVTTDEKFHDSTPDAAQELSLVH
jgi:S-adenosylmethionine decarboxylase